MGKQDKQCAHISKAIKQSNSKIYLTITGGGMTALIEALRDEGGFSKVYAGSTLPYGKEQTEKIFADQSIRVEKVVSSEAALALARYSLLMLGSHDGDTPPIAVGSSNSLATEHEREGREHRIHIAVITKETTKLIEIILQQGRQKGEEDLLTRYLIEYYIAQAAHVTKEPPYIPVGGRGESITQVIWENNNPPLALDMISQDVQKEYVSSTPLAGDIIIIPGSFNPITQAHKSIYTTLQQAFPDKKVFFELTKKNVDKGALSLAETIKRSNQFTADNKEFTITNAARYHEKINTYTQNPEVTSVHFAVGADTWKRIIDKKYYDNNEETMMMVLQDWREKHIQFIVFPRGGSKGFETYQSVNSESTLDPELLDALIDQEIDVSTFHNNYSSTYMRSQTGGSLDEINTITIPKNPFLENSKQFLANELVAGGVDVLSTKLLEGPIKKLISELNRSKFMEKTSIGLVGPVMEKAGFFVLPLINELIKNGRNAKIKHIWQGGRKVLKWDILIHDPIYVALMYIGQYAFESGNIALTALISYLISVPLAGKAELLLDKAMFTNLKNSLQKNHGAKYESYYEIKTWLKGDEKTIDEILAYFQGILEFELGDVVEQTISDSYYNNSLRHYEGKKTTVRVRTNDTKEGENEFRQQSTQLLLSRAWKEKTFSQGTYNFYPIEKQKVIIPHTDDTSSLIGLPLDKIGDEKRHITTQRKYINNPNGLFVAGDKIVGLPEIMIELKVYKDNLDLLRKATFLLLKNFGALETTLNKDEIMSLVHGGGQY